MQKPVSIRPLSESREWKTLSGQIDEAVKDPEFVRAVRRFIKAHSS